MVIIHHTQSWLRMDPLLDKWRFYEDSPSNSLLEKKHILNTLGWKPYQLPAHLFHIPLIFMVFDVLSMFNQFWFVLSNQQALWLML